MSVFLQFIYTGFVNVYRPPKPRPTCSAQGCKNVKKYSCSSNNLPVCSMECYKKVQLIPAGGVAVV